MVKIVLGSKFFKTNTFSKHKASSKRVYMCILIHLLLLSSWRYKLLMKFIFNKIDFCLDFWDEDLFIRFIYALLSPSLWVTESFVSCFSRLSSGVYLGDLAGILKWPFYLIYVGRLCSFHCSCQEISSSLYLYLAFFIYCSLKFQVQVHIDRPKDWTHSHYVSKDRFF